MVRVGPVAHGGHCVARLDDPDHPGGRAVFVRHALPGELVRLAITDDSHDRFWRAHAVEILEPSLDRQVPRCPVAGPGLCGGCDFQHVSLPAQRRLKAAVLAEQLDRLAGLTPDQAGWSGEVEAPRPVPVEGRAGVASTGPASANEADTGLGWRTRMRYQVDAQGRAGLRAHRSHEIVPLPDGGCRIAHPALPDVVGRAWAPGEELLAVAAASGPVLVSGNGPAAMVEERAAGRSWQVAADGFWQVHPAAADTLVDAVRVGLRPVAGERAFDFYCGVGLFAGALADAGCQVWGVESSAAAIRVARQNLADHAARVRFTAGRVEHALTRLPKRTDLVVLDPPRTGAGRRVMEAVAARRPRAVAYVACDPAALARDLGFAAAAGYRPIALHAYDLFPMTHHLECVAIVVPQER